MRLIDPAEVEHLSCDEITLLAEVKIDGIDYIADFAHATEGLAGEEDKRFLKLAQPFVDWLKEADSESDGSGSDSSEASSSDEE